MSEQDHSRLVSATTLGIELGLPILWLEEEARAGRLPCLRIDPGCGGRVRYLFDRVVVMRRLTERAAESEGVVT